jgi:hypothetical protein
MLLHNPTVRPAFPDGIASVTIGEDAHGADLAAKVNDVTETISRRKVVAVASDSGRCCAIRCTGRLPSYFRLLGHRATDDPDHK